MLITEQLEKKQMTKYKLSKVSGVPQATINDICSGKADLEKCSAGTLYRLAKVLGVSIEEILDSAASDHRAAFETFKTAYRIETGETDMEEMIQREINRIFQERSRAEKLEKVERYRHLNRFVRPHQILFVGSSLMEQFPIYELLLDRQLPYTIYNRGIGGTTTFELLENMDVCVYELQPDYIYINIGTNDLNLPDYTEEGLIDRYRRILQGIREHLPESRTCMLAYYPVNPSAAKGNPWAEEALRIRSNARINSANLAVSKLAEEMGAVFLDLNDGIKDEGGCLKAEYTIEGMHMYADGYVPVLEKLLPWLPGKPES